MTELADKKHILFLPEWYPNPEDIQIAIFVEKFARAASQFNKVSLIFCGPFSKSNKIELIMKKEGGFTSYFCYYPKQKRKLRAYNYFIRAHQMCFDKLKEDGVPDLVHLHMLFRNYIAYKKIYAKAIPKYLITEQWSGYLNGNYNKMGIYRKSIYKKAMANAYFVTAVSSKLKSAINNLFEIQNPIIILPNIAEVAQTNNQKSSTEFKILIVADLVDIIKNISGVIKAFGLSNLYCNSTLTIIGGGEDEEMLLEKAKLAVTENKKIEFLGQLDNVSVLKEMQNNHILITNSRHETFSMVTAEALLAGLPVICTKCGGPEEFVNEENGILIPVDDYQAVQTAIEKMSTGYKNYDSKKLANSVLQKFGINTVAIQLKNIYDQILN